MLVGIVVLVVFEHWRTQREERDLQQRIGGECAPERQFDTPASSSSSPPGAPHCATLADDLREFSMHDFSAPA